MEDCHFATEAKTSSDNFLCCTDCSITRPVAIYSHSPLGGKAKEYHAWEEVFLKGEDIKSE